MSVLIEWNTVVVRLDAIERTVPGGWAEFQRAVPTRMASFDGDLVGIILMAAQDVVSFLAHLRALGLEASRGEQAQDFVVVDFRRGPAQPVAWLEFVDVHIKPLDMDVKAARLVGATTEELSVPFTWKPEHSPYAAGHFSGSDKVGEELEFRRHDNGVDVYWHKRLHKEVFAARVYERAPDAPGHLAQEAAETGEIERLYKEAWAGMQASGADEMVPPGRLGWLAARKARRAIKQFDDCLAVAPMHWGAHFWKGKCLQAVGDMQASLDAYQSAWLLNPREPDIAREASISAIEAGRPDLGVHYAQEALRLQPDGTGLQVNLALAHMFAGNSRAAIAAAEAGIGADPQDQAARFVLRLVRAVSEGRVTRPASMGAIDFSQV